MKTFYRKSGPFSEQPFFKPIEIELMCRQELEKYNLFPAEPSPIRIDRFVEKRFNIQPTYEDLPSGILGFTLFSQSGVKEIVVAQSLDEEGTKPAERRIRTTLAHESGHGLLHAHLFAFGARPASLFGEDLDRDKPKILCRDNNDPALKSPAKKPPYRWWEYQANLAMGALLLPKSLVDKAVSSLLTSRGRLGFAILEDERRQQAVKLLSEVFDVNPIVAKIRLESLYARADEKQLTL